MHNGKQEWDIVISPQGKLLDIRLKELYQYRDLLWLWVRREYIGAYKQTLLGPLWHFISPVFSTLIYMLLYGKIAKLSTDGVPMFLFYNAGITIWNYFNGCFGSAAGAFSNHAGIFGKVYFPRLIMPLASIVTTLIKFFIQFTLFIVAYLYMTYYYGYDSDIHFWRLFYIPFSLFILAGIGFGFGIVVSSITTKYRDLNQLVGFGMQLLMFATPVIYAFSLVPSDIKKYMLFNPLIAPVECFKYALFGIGTFSGVMLIYSILCMLFLLFFGLVLFFKAEKNFLDNV